MHNKKKQALILLTAGIVTLLIGFSVKDIGISLTLIALGGWTIGWNLATLFKD